jgi:molecular chaperone GrpE
MQEKDGVEEASEASMADETAASMDQESAATNEERPESEEHDASEVEITELRAAVEEAQQQLLRQAAEFQNYRRRTDAERIQWTSHAQKGVLVDVLDVFDDLDRSLGAAREASDPAAAFENLVKGVELIQQKVQGLLKKRLVEPIACEGVMFDESLHEALMQQPATDEHPAGMVVQEIQRGYTMGDAVLRHARVIVSTD